MVGRAFLQCWLGVCAGAEASVVQGVKRIKAIEREGRGGEANLSEQAWANLTYSAQSPQRLYSFYVGFLSLGKEQGKERLM